MFELARKNRSRSVWLVCIMCGLLVAVGFTAAEIFAPGAGPAGVAVAALVAMVLTAQPWNGYRRFQAGLESA